MDLSTSIAGVGLKYPVLASAGLLTRNAAAIHRLAQCAGVGAAVIKTVCRESLDTPRPYLARLGHSLLNYDLSVTGVDVWLGGEFAAALEAGIPLIVSLYDESPRHLVRMAADFVRQGASMIELPVVGATPLIAIQQATQEIKQALDVPVIIKVGPDIPRLGEYAAGLESAGANAISAINTLGRCLGIDTETGHPILGSAHGEAWLSGEAVKPMALHCVAEIAQSVSIPVLGGGGIANGRDAVEMFMAGASCVHMQTAPILHGLGTYARVVREIEAYLSSHRYRSLDSIIGRALQYLTPHVSYQHFAPLVNLDACNACGACQRVCAFDAVTVADAATIDHDLCDGCGLCISVCPTSALRFSA